MSGASLDIASDSLHQLKKLAGEAEASRKVLEENLVQMADNLREIRRIQQNNPVYKCPTRITNAY